jgi:hypothetical protein
MQTPRSGIRARNLVSRSAGLLLMTLLAVMTAGITRANAQQPAPVPCEGGDVPTKAANSGGPSNVPSQPDLVVTGTCYVRPGAANKYYYNNVNILANGKLIFTETHADNTTPGDEQTDFWVAAIIVEGDGTATAPNGGAMMAGTAAAPYGSAGNHTGTVTIHLFGADQSKGNPFPPNQGGNGPGQGVLCKSAQVQNQTGPCGIPWDRWVNNGTKPFTDLPGGVKDYFYQYGPLMGDTLGTQFSASPYTPSTQGYFGYKVLAVSYGGSLQLFGYKGTPAAGTTPANTSSANSWIRLGADLAKNATQLTLASAPGDKWQAGDQIVVSTTDYLPAHYEQLTITNVTGTTVKFTPATKWAHKGTRYTLPAPSSQYTRLNLDPDLTTNGVEDRASVALLTRSIRIVSAGDKVTGVPANDGFPAASTGYYFGGHAVFRQGFKSVQIQGVEFAQMGEGGRMGRYPVHFHEARVTPANTFVEDSSVNESMTRWYVIHSTQNVLLARNVGFLSIGHGYYLEDGTEINNQLYSNIGIMARAAVQNAQNPRNVPGILALATAGSSLQYNSDVVNPSVFWITNGWNDFTGNMAAGAGTCGACYWLTPSLNSDTPDVYPMQNAGTPLPHQNWSNASGKPTYAGLTTQLNGIGGATPLKSFYKNYCSSAQNSFETVLATGACLHVSPPSVPAASGDIIAVKSISPAFVAPQEADMYYPRMVGNRTPIMCPNGDCTTAHTCNNQNPDNCAVTVLDHYTTSFNWAEQNVSAVWLRTNWYLLTDSVITDVQTAGLTFVSGGDYTRSSIPEGYWDLVGNTLFIGETQPTNAYAYDIGPFNADSVKLDPTVKCAGFTDACVNVAEGVSLPLVDFGTGQRMFNIYDGPVYQDSNGFLDITTTRGCTVANGCIYLNVAGVRANPAPGGTSYLANAAIGWKQPNGFYYPPAFHSRNLLFSNVDIRHYVIAPLFNRGTYLTNLAAVEHNYASKTSETYFNSYTDVDRQTELNDDDGSLTGLINNSGTSNQDTISVNEDPFFNAPVATPECDSNLGVSPANACSPPSKTMPSPSARTSPYDYVTTIIYPDCAVTNTTNGACGSYPNDVPPTFVYGPPQIGVGPPPKNQPILTQYAQYQNQIGRGGQWSKDCTAPFCYGVKLYRQLLTGTMPDPNAKPAPIPASREWLEWTNAGCGTTPSNCDWPYDRMAGEALWQRSVLTANEGTYYIDTTRTITTQQTDPYAGAPTDINVTTVECSERTRVGVIANCQPRSVSGFEGGQTYYVLLSYAKSTTTITYQIYVGTNFDLSTVTGVAAFAPGIHLQVSKTLPSGWPAATTWLTPASKLINGPDGKADILQVTVNLASFGPTNLLNPKNQAAGLCQPKSVCGWSGGNCTFMPVDTTDSRVAADPSVKARLQNACSNWAVKDLDFPNARLIGFSFTLPAAPNFVASNQYERPTPMAFPGTPPQPAWATLLKNTATSPDNATGGACFYSKIPGTTSGCPVSDPANTGPVN